jgi:hypothetical protein
VCLQDIEASRIASVAIVAIDSVLPMDVVGKSLRLDEQAQIFPSPQVFFTVTSGASVLFKWQVRTRRRLSDDPLPSGSDHRV